MKSDRVKVFAVPLCVERRKIRWQMGQAQRRYENFLLLYRLIRSFIYQKSWNSSKKNLDEGFKRENQYNHTGCNVYDGHTIKSQPMGFWIRADVLQYKWIIEFPSVAYMEKWYGIKRENGLRQARAELAVWCVDLVVIWRKSRTEFRGCGVQKIRYIVGCVKEF